MDIFDQLGVDVNDVGVTNSIDMYSQLREVTQELVKIRKERNLRQQDVADELMISRQAVAKIEDPNNNPKISTLIGYALAVGARINISVTKDQYALFD
ncbi:helix-turn-helix domain-containing protein [Trueperella bialowiezensis]|uniref:Transcriptional regulator, y4mF family n=1 Tax=Trueperella bialowiezensis TaxID=312285 RepID=A0A448PEE9_9ACTO|nr:helix-turn-helix transcriptional regulator [Trueperella bialowiezensis]VEI13270.1 transcriptional regulator, y4mF family [Trueperella bialowiezensis]